MKKWYNVRKKSEIRWYSFELDPKNLPKLKSGYEIIGPFNSLSNAFFDSIKHNDKYYSKYDK